MSAKKTAKTTKTPKNEAAPIVQDVLATPATDATPAPVKAKGKRKAKAKAEPSARKLSALDAAAKVLQESGQAMACQEMIAAMAAKDYWTSPSGKTPAATLYAAILRELAHKGDQARFTKTERGKFAYAGAR